MTNDNILSFRTKSQDILFCFQCLYQNCFISNEEKSDLTKSFSNCLSKDTGSFRDMSVICGILGSVLTREDLPPFLEEKTRSVYDAFKTLFEKDM